MRVHNTRRKRAGRITVDIDHPSQLKLLRTYFNAKSFFPKNKVEIKETGHGNHLRIHCRCNSIEKNLDVRRNLGDDPNRIAFDENRKRIPMLHGWVDTCFSVKLKGGRVTSERLCNVLALPALSQIPAKKLKTLL